MTSASQRDFTQGSIPRHLIVFALPMLASSVLQVMHNVIDTVWVGRFVGAQALGTVSVSFPLIFALLSLVIGITMASSVLVAQYRGAKDEKMVRVAVANSMMLLGLCGLLFSATGVIFRYPLLNMIKTPPEILHDAANYLGIVMAGIPVIFVYYAVESVLRGLGDSRTPLKFMMLSTVTNMILSPLLIIGVGPLPAWGVSGAAVATVIAQCLTAYLVIRYMVKQTDLVRLDRSYWQWDAGVVRLIFQIGIPAGLQLVLVSFSMVAVMAMINSHGAAVVAAFGAASRLDQLAFMPAISLGAAVGALVGQNLGALRIDRVGSVVRWSNLFAVLITGAVSAIAIFQPTLLMRLFTSDAGVLTEGTSYLRIVGASYVFNALSITLGGVMRGAGDTMPGLLFTVLSLWVLKVPLCWYLSQSMGINGIWIGTALSTVLSVLLHWGYYVSGRWQKRVVSRPASAQPDTAAVSD